MKKLVIAGILSAMLAGSCLGAEAYTDTDLDILSHVICGEAEGCSRDMKLSVGSVVLNRVKDERFPETIEEVVFQEGQYSCTWDGNYYRQPSEDTIDIAKYLLNNGSVLESKVVWYGKLSLSRERASLSRSITCTFVIDIWKGDTNEWI